MKAALRPKDLKTLRDIFKRFPEVKEARIFGSRANGAAKRSSDIDLAVRAPAMNAEKWSAFREAVEEAPIIFEYDLVRFDKLPAGPLRKKILTQGISIYP